MSSSLAATPVKETTVASRTPSKPTDGRVSLVKRHGYTSTGPAGSASAMEAAKRVDGLYFTGISSSRAIFGGMSAVIAALLAGQYVLSFSASAVATTATTVSMIGASAVLLRVLVYAWKQDPVADLAKSVHPFDLTFNTDTLTAKDFRAADSQAELILIMKNRALVQGTRFNHVRGAFIAGDTDASENGNDDDDDDDLTDYTDGSDAEPAAAAAVASVLTISGDASGNASSSSLSGSADGAAVAPAPAAPSPAVSPSRQPLRVLAPGMTWERVAHSLAMSRPRLASLSGSGKVFHLVHVSTQAAPAALLASARAMRRRVAVSLDRGMPLDLIVVPPRASVIAAAKLAYGALWTQVPVLCLEPVIWDEGFADPRSTAAAAAAAAAGTTRSGPAAAGGSATARMDGAEGRLAALLRGLSEEAATAGAAPAPVLADRSAEDEESVATLQTLFPEVTFGLLDGDLDAAFTSDPVRTALLRKRIAGPSAVLSSDLAALPARKAGAGVAGGAAATASAAAEVEQMLKCLDHDDCADTELSEQDRRAVVVRRARRVLAFLWLFSAEYIAVVGNTASARALAAALGAAPLRPETSTEAQEPCGAQAVLGLRLQAFGRE